VGVWACGRVGVWACGRVGVWACGRVGVSACRRDPGLPRAIFPKIAILESSKKPGYNVWSDFGR
jgi:hypothetical protein